MVFLDSFDVFVHGVRPTDSGESQKSQSIFRRVDDLRIARWPSGFTPYPLERRGGIVVKAAAKSPKNPGIPMPLINVVLTLIVVGVLLWLINRFIPMQSTIKSILNIVVVVAVVLWLLYGFGIISHSGNITVPVVK
jgi:hypothetical protein